MPKRKPMIAMPAAPKAAPATPDEFVRAGQPALWDDEPKPVLKRLTIDVPADTHRAFKALAARQGLDMKVMMLAAIRDYIEKE